MENATKAEPDAAAASSSAEPPPPPAAAAASSAAPPVAAAAAAAAAPAAEGGAELPVAAAKQEPAGGGDEVESYIPKGSVKRVIKIDKDVRMVGQDAVVAISKATELFVEAFAKSAAAKAAVRVGADSRPVVKYEDVYAARAADDNLIFLEGIVPQPTFVSKT
jgi:hypothetical protein